MSKHDEARREVSRILDTALSSSRELPVDPLQIFNEIWNPRDPKRRKFSSLTWTELKVKRS